ncbi:MAG: hypothetical protein Q4C72_03735 [Eubacteriales bacterium]|nr:hypothetical protein [Eubacteriales bacterium]
MVRYIVTEKEGSEKTQYGIAAVWGKMERVYIHDVAPTLEKTIHIAAFLQENGVAVEHFRDVLDDLLAE